jgi:hypothetical protein
MISPVSNGEVIFEDEQVPANRVDDDATNRAQKTSICSKKIFCRSDSHECAQRISWIGVGICIGTGAALIAREHLDKYLSFTIVVSIGFGIAFSSALYAVFAKMHRNIT